MTIVKGDLVALSGALERAGIDKAEIPKLESAVVEDRAESGAQVGIGPRARAWIMDAAAKLAMKVGEAGLDVAKAEAAKQLTALVTRYLGGS